MDPVHYLHLHLVTLLPIPSEAPSTKQLAYWWCYNLQRRTPLGPLLDLYIHTFSSKTRKDFSHLGACRYDKLLPYKCPLKWQAESGLAAGTWYADPRNYVYAKVLHFLVPDNVSNVQAGWKWRELNIEHKGDVIEAVLGAAYIALDESNWSLFFSYIGVLRNDIEWITHRIVNPTSQKKRTPKEFNCY